MSPSASAALWLGILVLATGSLCFAVLAWYSRRNWQTMTAAALLAAALVLRSVPAAAAPTPAAITLGVLALALAIFGGGPAALLTLRLATRGSVTPGAHGGILVPAEPEPGQPAAATREVLRAGLTIGVLERLAVTGAILGGQPGAVAVVVALKSVGRFTELGTPEAKERFIIGTFVSLIWACACGGLALLAR